MKKVHILLKTGVLIATVFSVYGCASFAKAAPLNTPVKDLPGLQSVTVWEMSRSSPGPSSAHTYDKNSSKLVTKIGLPASGSDFSTAAKERYDVYFSNADGTFNADGSYITVDCYRNSNYTNQRVGHNLDAIELRFNVNPNMYAAIVTHTTLGTGLSGAFVTNNGYAQKVLGPKDGGWNGGPDYNGITYLGDHFASITVGFEITPSCVPNVSKQCVGGSVYWFDSCGGKGDLFLQCDSNQTCQNGACVDQDVPCNCDGDCGTNGFMGETFCQSGNVYKNYNSYTCLNPGTPQSLCANTTTPVLWYYCQSNQTCSNGYCFNACQKNPYAQQCQQSQQ